MKENKLKKTNKKDVSKILEKTIDSQIMIQNQKNKKRIRLFLLLSSLVVIIVAILSIILFTNKKTEYVNVNFNIQDITFDAKINKGAKIKNSTVSYLNKLNYRSLFYDSERKEKYNNEPVDKDITIYVELEEKDYSNMTEDEVLLLIREDYLNQYVIPSYGEEYTIDGKNYYKYTIDDIRIYANYGCYNQAYVVSFSVPNAGVGWNLLHEYVVGGVSLVFPTTKVPYVWHNGYFYYLENAYNQGLLTVDDLEAIAKKLGEE